MLPRTALTSLIAVALMMGSLLAFLPTPEEKTQRVGSIAIEAVTLFDGEIFREDMTVVIEDGRVAALLEAGEPLPEGLKLIDGRGHTLLPGLIDAHVHSWGDALAHSLRFGVTTQVDMFSDPVFLAEAKTRRDSAANIHEADLFGAGMLATAPNGHGTQFMTPVEPLTSPEEAAEWVADRRTEGSDFIKIVYNPSSALGPSMDLPTAQALINAAHTNGMLAVAHTETLTASAALLDAGIDGFVHVFADEVASPAFIEKARAADIFVIPTLAVIASIDGRQPGSAVLDDPRLAEKLAPGQRAALAQGFPARLDNYDFSIAVENVRRLHDAGISILAGTDAENVGTTYGASLHQELEFLRMAGLSPVDVLRAATTEPAIAFGLGDRGRIAPGAWADLVLVGGDPRTDITATREIRQVFKRGQPLQNAQTEMDASGPLPLAANLGTFDTSLIGPTDLPWVVTSDEIAQGKSTASVRQVNGVLEVTADIRSGFAFPWAGAFLPLSEDLSTRFDITTYTSLSFRVRGTPGRYQVMAFTAGVLGRPATTAFSVTEEWQTITVALGDFVGLDRSAFAALAVVAGPQTGSYQFYIDDVTLNE